MDLFTGVIFILNALLVIGAMYTGYRMGVADKRGDVFTMRDPDMTLPILNEDDETPALEDEEQIRKDMENSRRLVTGYTGNS